MSGLKRLILMAVLSGLAGCAEPPSPSNPSADPDAPRGEVLTPKRIQMH